MFSPLAPASPRGGTVRSSLALGNPDPPPNSDAEPSGGDERIGVAQFIGSAILPARETAVGKQLHRRGSLFPHAWSASPALRCGSDTCRRAGSPRSSAQGRGRWEPWSPRFQRPRDRRRSLPAHGRKKRSGRSTPQAWPWQGLQGATGKARQMVLESCLAAERLRALPMGFSTCTGVGA